MSVSFLDWQFTMLQHDSHVHYCPAHILRARVCFGTICGHGNSARSRRQRGPTLHRMFEGLHLSWKATNRSSEIWTQTRYESATIDLAQNCFWLGLEPVSVCHRSCLTPTQIQLRSVLDLPASWGEKLGAMKWGCLFQKRGKNSALSHFKRKTERNLVYSKAVKKPQVTAKNVRGLCVI